ncbi:MAG: hypothetical protein JW923_02370 [Spirochaetales bacterium]|nr:hypothetical protein [Spirochaetales bacterium]
MPVFSPALFQGSHKRRRYFEGWYFKHVSADGKAWSFIPGISMDATGLRRGAFVQAIDGTTGETLWYDYPFEAFSWDKKTLDVRVGASRFSMDGVQLDLDGPQGALRASLAYGSPARFPARPWRPGIMGPYSFVPFMECNHGLLSLDHRVDGWVERAGRRWSFDGGRGYIEKDWGSSMPAAWIWSQSNSFEKPGTSLMFSVASIPWLAGAFTGFLCAARFPEKGKDAAESGMHVWATWNGSRLTNVVVCDTAVELCIGRRDERVELALTRGRGGLLRAPVAGTMERRIAESVDASMRVRYLRNGTTVFDGQAAPAGLETVGDLGSLGATVQGTPEAGEAPRA